MDLSEEQKRKIEENRRRALERRLQKTSSAPVHSSSSDQPRFGVYTSFRETPAPPPPPAARRTMLLDYLPSHSAAPPRPAAQVPGNKPPTAQAPANKPPTAQAPGNRPPTAANPKRREWKKAETAKRVTIHLCAPDRVEATSPFHQGVIEVFKGLASRNYDPVTKKWRFSIKEHDLLVHRLEALPGVAVDRLPKKVLEVFLVRLKEGEQRIPAADLSHVDKKLVDALMPFQRDGVNFGVAHNGRLLLADDMGLGKTIQALCLAAFYRSAWPLLVVAPSSVRYAWRDQILRWLGSVSLADVRVVDSSKDFRDGGVCSSILVISYDLLAKNARELSERRFQVVIMDECHFLKNAKAARTKAAMPILHAARHVFLLSGTPALSRPSELFTQVTAVMPSLFRSFHDFGLRYCDGKEQPWGWDYSGCSNMTELQLLLEEKVMVRRTKEQVLTQLPEKRREMFILDPSLVKRSALDRTAKAMLQRGMKGGERRGALLQYFHETAKVKLPAIKQYILDMVEGSSKKFLVFAHHQEVLDALEELLGSKGVDHIRIDGRTPADRRRSEVERFQLYPEAQVALLSITAANSGVNLTAASLVIFAELFWNPGILVQAEDRVYRIGQRNCVSVQYLVANGTADDYVWPLVQEKLEVLGRAGLNRESFRDADTTQLGQRDASLLHFFRTDFLEAPAGAPLLAIDMEAPAVRRPEEAEVVIVPESPEAFADLSDWEEEEEGEGERTLVNQTGGDEALDAAMAQLAEGAEREEVRRTASDFSWLTEEEWDAQDVSWVVNDDDAGWCGGPEQKRPRCG